ncbi:MAG: hypothetical protein ACPG4T_21100 [Nannocystaceae bacterium]
MPAKAGFDEDTCGRFSQATAHDRETNPAGRWSTARRSENSDLLARGITRVVVGNQ